MGFRSGNSRVVLAITIWVAFIAAVVSVATVAGYLHMVEVWNEPLRP